MLGVSTVSKSEEQHDLDQNVSPAFQSTFENQGEEENRVCYVDEFLVKSLTSEVRSGNRRLVPLGTFLLTRLQPPCRTTVAEHTLAEM